MNSICDDSSHHELSKIYSSFINENKQARVDSRTSNKNPTEDPDKDYVKNDYIGILVKKTDIRQKSQNEA